MESVGTTQQNIDERAGFQAPLIDAFLDLLEEEVIEAQMRDKYDDGVLTFKPLSLRIAKSFVLFKDPETDASATLHALMARSHPHETLSFEDAQNRIKLYPKETRGSDCIYVAEGKEGVVLRIPVLHRTKQRDPLVRLITPGGTSFAPASTLGKPASVLSIAAAEQRWNALYSNTFPPERPMFAVCGTLLPIWDKLPDDLPKIYRMKTDDGVLLLGRIVPRWQIREVLAHFPGVDDPLFEIS